jgi:hypothetical protein
LGEDRAEQPRVKRRYLVQQDKQDETARQKPENPAEIELSPIFVDGLIDQAAAVAG